jgi:hypothetical protein
MDVDARSERPYVLILNMRTASEHRNPARWMESPEMRTMRVTALAVAAALPVGLLDKAPNLTELLS